MLSVEDLLESLIGEEIVDESDAAVDMQAVALRRKKERFSGLDARASTAREADAGEEGKDPR